MDGGARPRPRPASPELRRCGRRRAGPGAPGTPGGGAAAVARRNERERNRVRLVNLGFQALRQHVPRAGAGGKLSKVETLRSAAEYIRALQRLLAEHERDRDRDRAGGPRAPAASEPGSPRSAYSSDDGGCEAAPSPAERALLDLCWLGGF